jgi:hypothetical protein
MLTLFCAGNMEMLPVRRKQLLFYKNNNIRVLRGER